MLGAGARLAIGVDPFLLFVIQFWAIKRFAPDDPEKYVDYTMRKDAFNGYIKGGTIKYIKDSKFGIPYELPPFNSFLSQFDRIFRMHFAEVYRKFPNKLVDK